jgi:hypothetical protein
MHFVGKKNVVLIKYSSKLSLIPVEAVALMIIKLFLLNRYIIFHYQISYKIMYEEKKPYCVGKIIQQENYRFGILNVLQCFLSTL